MRKAMIKEVRELTERELELLLSNDDIRDDIVRYANDMESLYIDEMFEYIRPHLYDYSIGSYGYSYMKVDDQVRFIIAIDDMNNDFGILNDDMVNTLKLAIKAANDYTILDMCSDDYYDAMYYMSLYIKDISDYLISKFVAILDYYDSYEKIYLESDYIDIYIENIFDHECLIDDDNVTLI